MPEKKVIERAKKDKREGKSASTQAGEFVREEIDHIRQGKHGARSTRQAIAIGLSEARRAGVDLPPPKKGEASRKTIKQAKRDRAAAKKPTSKTAARKSSSKRARASSKALKREGHSAASRQALSKHARKSARKRSASERSAAAKKAARIKGAKIVRLRHARPRARAQKNRER